MGNKHHAATQKKAYWPETLQDLRLSVHPKLYPDAQRMAQSSLTRLDIHSQEEAHSDSDSEDTQPLAHLKQPITNNDTSSNNIQCKIHF